MKKELEAKLKHIVELLDNLMVDPDIDIEYCIPEVATTAESCSVDADPYFLVKYSENKYITRKIRLTEKYLDHTPEEIADFVTFTIEQFKGEVDSVNMG